MTNPETPVTKPRPRQAHSFSIDYETLEIKFMFAQRSHAVPLISGDQSGEHFGVGVSRDDLDAWGLKVDVTVAELKMVREAIFDHLYADVTRNDRKRCRAFLAGAVMARFDATT